MSGNGRSSFGSPPAPVKPLRGGNASPSRIFLTRPLASEKLDAGDVPRGLPMRSLRLRETVARQRR